MMEKTFKSRKMSIEKSKKSQTIHTKSDKDSSKIKLRKSPIKAKFMKYKKE